MSHWQAGKIELKCSLALLKDAIIDLKPEWEGHVRTSEKADLDLYGYTGQIDSQKYNLAVAGCKNPQHKAAPSNIYGDLGLYQQEDGTWGMQADLSGILGTNNFEGALKKSIAALKVKKIASQDRNRQTGDFQRGSKRVIRMIAPVADQYKI